MAADDVIGRHCVVPAGFPLGLASYGANLAYSPVSRHFASGFQLPFQALSARAGSAFQRVRPSPFP
jgi:hypothetical protein